ncbi:hypothetical protein KPY62_12055 [Psychrobacter sp. TAE2020]|uniref:hypothetical protein n=1 Tax=Psychrobacter sp. TAE2020 TaxID=2846762 RepID=UPI001C1241EF|nr:hypothetical protein [Psychrobacter sp. TAE2020]MBU5617810.1 hypothetical protein [Psychrobacter sp. TAE2020]
MNSSDKDLEPKSAVTTAVKKSDAEQIKINLDQSEQDDKPQKLTAEEATPFIDEKSRTDK